jgi:hypothetical protein
VRRDGDRLPAIVNDGRQDDGRDDEAPRAESDMTTHHQDSARTAPRLDVQTEPPHPSGWLIMLYLAGDNDLNEQMVLALQELQREGVPSGDKVVAQLDPGATGLPGQRYDFTGAEDDGPLRPPVAIAPNANTGSPEALVAFAQWALERYPDPSLNRLLVLSGHGSGATEDFLLQDDSARDSLSIPQLRAAAESVAGLAGRPLEILGFDACFMSMGEVVYELKDSVQFVVGAEGLVPAFGWPYGRILAALNKSRRRGEPPMTPRALATTIVDQYVKHYAAFDLTAGRSVDLAATDTQGFGKVATAFSRLVEGLHSVEARDHNEIVLAHWYAQTYKFDQFVDLADLCDQLRLHVRSRPEIAALSEQVHAALQGCVVRTGCSGFAYQYSHGLSIYFPWAYISPEYGNASFAWQTGWHDFLVDHIRQTRRPPRQGFSPPPLSDAGTIEAPINHLISEVTMRDQHQGPSNAPLSRFSAHTRYKANTRYSAHTRYQATRATQDRARSIKNLPPAVGYTVETPGDAPPDATERRGDKV